MIAAKQSIFRDRALKHYTQGRKKDVLPNFSSISVAIFAWLLAGSLLATCLIAFCGQAPVYLAGSGIMLGTEKQITGSGNALIALVFFAPEKAARLRLGQPAQVQPGSGGAQLTGSVIQVQPGATSLAAALKHYGLDLSGASQTGQQVAVALLKINAGASAALYAGSALVVQMNVGTQSLFTALTGIGNT